jgi:hypothetical protein
MHTLGISNRLSSVRRLKLPTVGSGVSRLDIHICNEEQHNNNCIPIADAKSKIFLHTCYKSKA